MCENPMNDSLGGGESMAKMLFCLTLCTMLPLAEFSIWTREAGAGGLSIAVEGPSKAEIAFEDRKDGSSGVSYIVQEPGEIEWLCFSTLFKSGSQGFVISLLDSRFSNSLFIHWLCRRL